MDVKSLANIPPWDRPEGTDEILFEVLQDEGAEESERLLAAEMSGEYTTIDDRLAAALLSIVESGDETDRLRGTAAISLGPALENASTSGFEDPDDILVSEDMFHRIQRTLQKLYMDADVPKDVRRRILEAAVRAPQEWQEGAIRVAYSSDDPAWRLTAVFCMRFVRGFDRQIVEALDSENRDIHYHAVEAAGNWEVEAAWPHVANIVTSSGRADKELLFAAIAAVASIRPEEAQTVLGELADSEDEDIQDAISEALAMAGVDEDLWGGDEDEDLWSEDEEDDELF